MNKIVSFSILLLALAVAVPVDSAHAARKGFKSCNFQGAKILVKGKKCPVVITSAGPSGPKGDKGDTGAKGDQGIQGLAGPQGAAGANGSNGTNGTNGQDGAAGQTGAQGPVGPQGPAGAPGQFSPDCKLATFTESTDDTKLQFDVACKEEGHILVNHTISTTAGIGAAVNVTPVPQITTEIRNFLTDLRIHVEGVNRGIDATVTINCCKVAQ